MGGPAAFLDLIFPARHSIVSPEDLPDLWVEKLTGGYDITDYSYVTYPEEGEEYRGKWDLFIPRGHRHIRIRRCDEP